MTLVKRSREAMMAQSISRMYVHLFRHWLERVMTTYASRGFYQSQLAANHANPSVLLQACSAADKKPLGPEM